MEYRVHGVGGTRVEPSIMLTCTANGRVSMPSSLGYAAWDLVPTNQDPKKPIDNKPNIYTPAASNACLATSVGAATPNRPAATGARGPASATIRWGVVPAGVNHTLVTIEQWHPSLGKYGQPVNRTVAGRASSTRFTGLLNGRPYRFRVATHNGAGYSAWSPYINVTPSMVPSAPRAPRALSTTRDSIRYAWWLPANNGRAITRFQVARRCVVGGSWTAWAYTSVAAHLNGSTSWTLHYNWTRMPRGRTCQVTVRAVNSVGYGPWSVRSKATTLR
jgi:cellulose 1,4-beta-cellobiosidase